MIEVTGDIWDYPADIICITTNGSIRGDGKAVMGRGVAKQAKDRLPIIATVLGHSLKDLGRPSVCKIYTYIKQEIWAFPVKYYWRLKADEDLIRSSAIQLRSSALLYSDKTFVLPRPGCGNGQLDWKDVKKIISPLLPDNVHVIDLS